MVRRRSLLILIGLLWSFALAAQAQKVYTGRVVKEDGQAIPRASVVLKDKRGRVVSFSRSDAKGSFSLKQPEGKQADSLSVRCIGYASKSIALEKYKNGRTIALKERVENIKEVVVKPKDMWRRGDTLTYNVAQLTQKQDKYIEDVIKHIPGVTVSPTGSISYLGKEINKFYVEGMDLMGNRYAQVSRNLTADKVRNVQVYENHEPVKMNRGIKFSEQAAMNIQLKDGAKGVWTGVAEAGTGLTLQDKSDWLRDGRLVGMLFGSKRQSLSMYKTNNTGKDISSEVNMKGGGSSMLSNLVSPSSGASSFNNSHLFASNWLFKTSEDANLRFQLAGFMDKSNRESYSESHYFDESGGQTVMIEDQSLTGKTNQWSADMNYEYNGSTAFVRNSLSGYMNFDKGYGSTLLNGTSVNQFVKPRKRSVSDYLSVSKKWGSQVVELRLNGDYSYMPGTLLLKDGGNETLNMKVINLQSEFSFSHKLWKDTRLWYTVGTISKIELMDVCYDEKSQSDRFALHKLYASPSFSYGNKKFSFNISPKFNLLYRSITQQKERLAFVDPSVDAKYKFNENLEFNAGYRYVYYAGGSLASLTKVPYYASYNFLSQGMGEFTHSTSHTFGTGLQYNNVEKKLAGNFSFSANQSKTNLYQGTINDDVYSKEMTSIKKNSRYYQINGSLSKHFSFLLTQLSLNANHSWRHFYFLKESQPEPACNRNTVLNLDLSFRPLMILSVNMGTTAMFNTQDKKLSESGMGSFSNYDHSLNVFFMPGRWQLNWKACYSHSTDKTSKSCFRSDASVMYRTKSFDIGLYLNNIFGSHEYHQRTVTEYGEFYNISYLRPTELIAKCSFNL